MLKQDVKQLTLNLFEHMHLFQLSFIQFRPYATSFPGLLLSLTLMPKSKKTLEKSLDLTPSFKTSFHARVEGSCFECGLFGTCAVILFNRNMAETDVCCAHTFFLYGLFTLFMTRKRAFLHLHPRHHNVQHYSLGGQC